MTTRLELQPLTLAEANAFVEQHHRHHGPVVGHKFCIGCNDGEKVVGVVIVGRPVSRGFDHAWVAEVTRLCTDGTPHVASKLYAAAWRAARAMGYKKMVTYILDTESGTSLYAAGWRLIAETRGGSWSTSGRPRVDKHPLQRKLKFEVTS